MRYALEPAFRKTVARSIYKAMLRYLRDRESTPFSVQPLEPLNTRIQPTEAGYKLTWTPQHDPVESTAKAAAYMVYHSTLNSGWDHGTLVYDTVFALTGKQWSGIHRFQVEAVNAGGRSLPGEVAYLAIPDKRTKSAVVHLAVSGAEESGPGWIQEPGYQGVDLSAYPGQSRQALSYYTGPQYDYQPSSPFVSNDAPGHGASMAIWEGQPMPQAQDWGMGGLVKAWFDMGFTVIAGTTLPGSHSLKAGDVLALHFGNQHRITKPGLEKSQGIWTPEVKKLLLEAAQIRCKLLLSGSYIGSEYPLSDTLWDKKSAAVLGWKWRGTGADGSGLVHGLQGFPDIKYGVTWGHAPYHAPMVDALESRLPHARVLGRYGAGQKGAVVGLPEQSITAGFPIETLEWPHMESWLKAVVQWLKIQ
jgi:hypothetical protein